MRIGIQMRNFVNDMLVKTFKTHEERSAAFYSLMVNFLANSVSEISEPERLHQNIEEIIVGIRDWLKGTQGTIIKFHNLKSPTIKKEDLH